MYHCKDCGMPHEEYYSAVGCCDYDFIERCELCGGVIDEEDEVCGGVHETCAKTMFTVESGLWYAEVNIQDFINWHYGYEHGVHHSASAARILFEKFRADVTLDAEIKRKSNEWLSLQEYCFEDLSGWVDFLMILEKANERRVTA